MLLHVEVRGVRLVDLPKCNVVSRLNTIGYAEAPLLRQRNNVYCGKRTARFGLQTVCDRRFLHKLTVCLKL